MQFTCSYSLGHGRRSCTVNANALGRMLEAEVSDLLLRETACCNRSSAFVILCINREELASFKAGHFHRMKKDEAGENFSIDDSLLRLK